MRIYAVLDRKAKMVCCTFVAPNDENAIRSFEDLLTVPEDTVFTLHPEDFTLVKAFEVEDSTLFKLDSVVDGSSFSRAVLAEARKDRADYHLYLASVRDKVNEVGGFDNGNK